MGLIAKNPQEDTRQQGSGDLLGSPPAYATGTVHHDAVAPDGTVTHHSQRFERGELVEWTVTDGPGPWALVRPGPPTRPYRRGRATPEMVEEAKIRVGGELLAMPPADDLPAPSFRQLADVPDATARLRYQLLDTPVGDVLCDIRYQDGQRPWGRIVDEWPEHTHEGEPAHDAPEMVVTMTFPNYLRLRTGEMDSLEAIADGGDVSDTRWTLLLLLHGIVQSDEYVAAYAALPVIPPELGWWAQAAAYVPGDAVPTD